MNELSDEFIGAEIPRMTDTVDKVAPAERRRNIVIRNLARLNHCCGRRQPGESLLRVRPSKIVYQQYRPISDIGGSISKPA